MMMTQIWHTAIIEMVVYGRGGNWTPELKSRTDKEQYSGIWVEVVMAC